MTSKFLPDVTELIVTWPILIGTFSNFASPWEDANQTNSVFDGFSCNLIEAIQLLISAMQDSILDAAILSTLYQQCVYTWLSSTYLQSCRATISARCAL